MVTSETAMYLKALVIIVAVTLALFLILDSILSIRIWRDETNATSKDLVFVLLCTKGSDGSKTDSLALSTLSLLALSLELLTERLLLNQCFLWESRLL